MNSPLADRIRPQNLQEVVGQKHLLGEGKALRGIIESGKIPNMIFYGPSGVGKTTVARIVAEKSGMHLHKLNATTASTSDIKAIISEIGTLQGLGGILLYLDEIQYFSKKQQQILLEFIESGDITLIASTTENPYFSVYNAILSRSTVFEFKQISSEEIVPAVLRAAKIMEEELSKPVSFVDKSEEMLASVSGGDVRRAINMVEVLCLSRHSDEKIEITKDRIAEIAQTTTTRYDRDGDEHYDVVSAYQKSMRGSDPDAALHYLARLLEAGDLPSACRRLMVCAAEDVGLANPQILPIVKAAVDIANMVGLPEARIPLADAVVLVAISPKSATGHDGINAAMNDLKLGKTGPIPRNLQNKHFDGEDAVQKGQNYLYPHDYKNHYVEQNYLPETLKDVHYYNFGDNKFEQGYKQYWEQIKGKKL